MPCECAGMDSGPSYKEEADKVTDLLCQVCRLIEDHNLETLWVDGLKTWWKRHKAEDNARLKEEQRQEQIQREYKMAQFLKLKKELGVD